MEHSQLSGEVGIWSDLKRRRTFGPQGHATILTIAGVVLVVMILKRKKRECRSADRRPSEGLFCFIPPRIGIIAVMRCDLCDLRLRTMLMSSQSFVYVMSSQVKSMSCHACVS